MFQNKINKQGVKFYLFILTICIIAIIVATLMLKYYEEGESNLPFNISEILIISTADTEDIKINDDVYTAEVLQKNDIYITIQKNENYKKEDSIEKITLSNFKIEKQSLDFGVINLYRTSKNENENFNYSDEYIFQNEISFIGAKNTNLKQDDLQIANQGGTICFSIANKNLGEIEYVKEENLKIDGLLLKEIGIYSENIQNIQASIEFDAYIELQSGKKFKTTISFLLPASNILEEGISSVKIDTEKLVFKR